MTYLKTRLPLVILVSIGLRFSVPLPIRAGTLTGTFSSIATGSNVNLTTTGKLDWVHWGLYTENSIDRKASVTPQISNFTLLGDNSTYTLAAYQYADNSNSYSWYDGTPQVTVTNTTTGVWAYDYIPIGSGFQFTVPADTTQKTLFVYVGAFAAEGKLTASLSDNSAPAFTSSLNATVNNFSNGPSGVFAITFAANSSNQTLTVTWTLTRVNGNPTGAPNVTLQAAALTAPNANNPPYVALNSPTNDSTWLESNSIIIQANAQDFDGTVTNVAFFADTNELGQISTSPYNFTWKNPTRGHYTLTARATDNAGVTGNSQPIEIFVYGSGGGQTNTINTNPPVAVDLTSDGTADWTHWGLITNTSFDYKNLVPRQISNFTELGTNPIQQLSDNYTAFSWSDGTPTPSASSTTTGVFVTGQNNGFMLTAPADQYPRQLTVYVGGYGVQGKFEAYLSDFSAPPLIDTASVSNVYGDSYVAYTINYTAATNNQHLILVWRSLNLYDSIYGNVTLQAATLQSEAPQAVQITNLQWQNHSFVFSFATQVGFNYTAQYTYSLNPASWQTLTSIPGDGTTLSVTNQNATNATCFYRVLAQ